MKKNVLLTATVCICLSVFSQAPYKFKYQAVVRDEKGNIRANQPVELAISILAGSDTGPAVYSEQHPGIATNAYGLVTLNIGEGTNKLGDIAVIDWGSNSYYLSIEMRNGTTWVAMGSSQLLSVPYAVYSNKAGSSDAAHGYEAGEGIAISKTGVITNTAPDKTIAFTAGNGINVSGTYPDFTLSNTAPNATHSGDASGSATLRVTRIQGNPVADTTPAIGDALKWDGSRWAPSPSSYIAGSGISISSANVISNTSPDKTVTIEGTGIVVGGSYPNFTLTNASPNATHTGDATGTTELTVTGIRGKPVSTAAPASGQFLQFNGSQWAPASLTAGNGISFSGNQMAVNGTNTIVASAQNAYVISGSPVLTRYSGGILMVQDNATISVPISVPLILNGVAKKIVSASICYISAAGSITKTVVKDCAAGNGYVICQDNTSRNNTSWTTYTIAPPQPYPLTGSVTVELDIAGSGIVLQNITVVFQD